MVQGGPLGDRLWGYPVVVSIVMQRESNLSDSQNSSVSESAAAVPSCSAAAFAAVTIPTTPLPAAGGKEAEARSAVAVSSPPLLPLAPAAAKRETNCAL